MIANKFEYMEFLIQGGLQESSANSYGSYLEAISKHLEININISTVSSGQDIAAILNRLSGTILPKNSKNNCGTALRAYFRFLEQEQSDFSYPDEIINPTEYMEGAKKQITVNSYERDRGARNKAIEIHGLNCSVCNINFENIYGEIGVGFIHVHHLKPLHTIDKEYEVNPEYDLVPICPNCHAMLHRSKKPPSIAQLTDAMQSKRPVNPS